MSPKTVAITISIVILTLNFSSKRARLPYRLLRTTQLVLFLLMRMFYLCISFFILIFILVTECSSLSPPDNGDITPSICKTRPLHGQECRYKCNPGYTIVGFMSTRCANGHWSHAGVQCRGKPYSFS